MSNTRHANGRIPAALARDGQPAPPSPDAAEQQLARMIGEAAAVGVTEALARILPGMAWQPACVFCVMAAKAAEHAHQVAVQNAQQAAEEPPEAPPLPPVAQSITVVITQAGLVPACWQHIEPPQAMPRQTGLLAPDGRPIIAAGG